MKGKKFVLVVTALAFILVTNISVNAETYVSGRETVTITGITCDGSYSVSNLYSPAGGAGSNITGSIKLWGGINISQLEYMNFTVWNNETTNTTFNLWVNGIKLIDNANVMSGAELTKTKSDYISLSGNTSLTYINWTLNANQTDDEYLNITIILDNGSVIDIDGVTSIKEWVKTSPHIEMNKEDTWYSVEDKITVTNDATIDLTNINITISYPYQALNPTTHTITISSLNSGQSTSKYISYQKQGPYVRSIGTPSQNSFGEYELYMRIKAYEDEDNVTWDIDPTSSEWSAYFPHLNTDTLEIYINDEPVDFTIGSIHMTEIELTDGLNDVYMKWTPAQQPITPTPTGRAIGIDLYIGVVAVIVALIALIYLTTKKK